MHVEFEMYDAAVSGLSTALKKLQKFYPLQYNFEAYLDFFDSKTIEEILELNPGNEKSNEEIDAVTSVIYFSGLMSKLTKELYSIMRNYEMIQQDINSYKKDIIQFQLNENSLKDDIKRLKNIVRQDYFDLAEQHDNDLEFIDIIRPDLRVKKTANLKKLLINVCEN